MQLLNQPFARLLLCSVLLCLTAPVQVLGQHARSSAAGHPGAAAAALAAAPAALAAAVPAAAPPIPTLITVAASATVVEQRAATELASYLNNISAGTPLFHVQPASTSNKATPQLAVGYDAAVLLGLPSGALAGLGMEGLLVSTNISQGIPAGSAVLTGGKDAPRGPLYAVVEFVEALGVRFLDRLPGGTTLPEALPASLPALDTRFVPPLEYRQQYQFGCNNYGGAGVGAPGGVGNATMDWNVHRRLNKATLSGESPTSAFGSSVVYAAPPGFVHTSYALLSPTGKVNDKAPPADLFATHNEWFWPRDDPTRYGQLCWSNESLQKFIIGNLKQQLKTQPEATIVSVSQNDNGAQCQDPAELKINEEEGTAGGALFRAVNAIADGLKDEFPSVAIDTLAYQWSRPAPKLTKPRPNVVIRLCSIECNFAVPLTDPLNVKFQTDMTNWAKVSNRTFIWNYITNFGNFIAPFPDWYSVGPNVRFYQEHGVTGIFQEGAYTGPGSDLMELKDYLASAMMWDPSQDDRKLISEFLDAYYGKAAPFVRLYMDTMHGSISDTNFWMGEGFPLDAAFLTPIALLTSATAFVDGRATVTGLELERLNRASLAVYYPILMRWAELRSFAQAESMHWPLEPTIEGAFDAFASAFNATTAAYCGDSAHCVAPAFREGATGSLAQVRSLLFNPSAACKSGVSSRKMPLSVQASGWYPATAPHSLLGSINEGASSGWVEFTLALPSDPGWSIGGVTAVPEMSPAGPANHTILLDGAAVHSWTGTPKNHEPLNWSPSTATHARTLRIQSAKQLSWVDWVSISIYTCDE